MKEKIQRFMMGRYGVDDLNRFLMILFLILGVINLFLRNMPFNLLLVLCIFALYYRMLSKQHSKRYQENVKFLQIKGKVLQFFQRKKRTMEDKKHNHIFVCPTCKQKIRIPKGKGLICITCPKCRTEFEKRS